MSCAMSRASSLSRAASGGLADALPSPSPSVLGRQRPTAARRARTVRVRAEQQPQQQPKGSVTLAAIQRSCEKFVQRYDPVTTGLGSLLVAGYCMVAHEQSVGEALNIAACATVVGMVMQEIIFNNDPDAKNEA